MAALHGYSFALIGVLFVFIHFLSNRYFSPLRKVPGPWLASVTRLWKLKKTLNEDMQWTNIELHRKYGPIVRIAPDEVSLDDPTEGFKIIYGHGTKFTKSRWYEASDAPGDHSLFTDSNIQRHAHDRRMVANAFSMTALRDMEPYIDNCVKTFMTRLQEFADNKQSVDMAHWLQCYAFDVIGEITFSKRFGFLDRGEDVGNIMQTLDGFLSYSAKMGVIPELHAPYTKFMNWLYPGGVPLEALRDFSSHTIEDRKKTGAEHLDFVSRFLQVHETHPEEFPMSEVYKICMVLVGAGSDTTAIALRAIIYFLCTNPEKMAKLKDEIDNSLASGTISNPITYTEAMKLPYLQAVLKEAMRLHPSTGFTLGRIVPKGGTEILGYNLPEGTTVGINSWVAHRNPSIFGEDVDSFIPERWLADKETVTAMDRYFLEFGAGSRTCLGKNISIMEMAKLIPQIIQKFDIQLIHPETPWKVTNWWLVKQTGIQCSLVPRERKSF